METVVAFNNELSGLYESKPPISKAKMTSITRSAMKAIKFYKHVVQSVEKFILKCKQEYKIPGLYVIDSIVRQSRHQFGTEKDVFAPRFARNMQSTFINLFQCSPEDKSKLIRVLNLWQKNNVFAPEVIQPLFDLANPSHPIYQNQGSAQDPNNANGLMPQESPSVNMIDEGHTMSSDMSGPISVMSNANQFDSSTIRQLQQLQQILIRQTNAEPIASTSANSTLAQDSVKFNKKLLDYDYGDDDDDDKGQSPRQSQQQSSSIDNSNISSLLNDPNVLRQLQNLQKLKQQEEKQSKLAEMRMQEEAFEKQLATMLKKLPFANECDLTLKDSQMYGIQGATINAMMQQQQTSTGIMASNANDNIDPEVELVSDDGKVEVINLDGNSRSPSVDRDRYRKSRRSRSHSRDRMGRRRRSRTRSRSPRSRRRGSSKDRDRGKDKEKERERKRKGLPDIKREHLSVCSTTLWIGHLSKLVQQEELSDTFAKYGDIVSIDMIHPRGCAFIVMHRRQDAFKAMGGLKNHKLHGRAITLSWAAGKGVKSKEWKDYWDLDLGVSYIPWNKINENTDFEQLEEGGMFDEDTLPEWLTEKLKNQSQKKDTNQTNMIVGQMPSMAMFNMDTTQPPPGGQMMGNVPQLVPAYPMGAVPRFMPPMLGPNIPLQLGVPPPMNGQMMMPQPGMVPGMPPMSLDKPPPTANSAYMGYFPPMPQVPPMPQATPHKQQPFAGKMIANFENCPPIGGNFDIGSKHSGAMEDAGASINSDDHMDIEMDEETLTKPNSNIMSPMNMFNRPPPQLFGPNIGSTPGENEFGNKNDVPNFNNSGSTDGRSDSREPIGLNDRDRELRNRGRDRERSDIRGRGVGNRDNRRNDFSNDKNSRWPNHKGRSRDGEIGGKPPRPDSRERNDSRSRERVDRDKTLQDRLRDLAGDGNNRGGDFNNARNNMQWRDGMPHSMNFAGTNNYGERRQLGMSGMPPALEDIRIPLPLESLRGPSLALGNKNHHGRGFDFNRGGPPGPDEFDRRQMAAGQPNRDYFVPNRFGMPGMNNPPIGMIRGNLQQFGPRNNSPMFMWGPRAGPNNERPFFDRDGASDGGSFNRGERVRGISGSSDGRNRGPRQNWKDNDDTPYKNRNNRRIDNHRDMRKSSRWGNNSPKSIASEENWNSENPQSPSKKSTPRNKSENNDSNKSSDAPPPDDAQANDSHETNDYKNDQPTQESNPADTNDTKNKPSPSRKTSATSMNARSAESNQGNTTPLYDEPAEAPATEKNDSETFPSKNQQPSSNANDENVAEIETINTE